MAGVGDREAIRQEWDDRGLRLPPSSYVHAMLAEWNVDGDGGEEMVRPFTDEHLPDLGGAALKLFESDTTAGFAQAA